MGVRKFTVPPSNVGKGGIITGPVSGKRYHVPSWTEVDDDTTLEDIIVEKRDFTELFEEPKEQQWEFISARSGDKYIVRYNVRGDLSCSCWGYIAHKRCKHIKEVEKNFVN